MTNALAYLSSASKKFCRMCFTDVPAHFHFYLMHNFWPDRQELKWSFWTLSYFISSMVQKSAYLAISRLALSEVLFLCYFIPVLRSGWNQYRDFLLKLFEIFIFISFPCSQQHLPLNPWPLVTGLKLLGSWLLLYDQPFPKFYFYAILSPCWEAVGFNTVISCSNFLKYLFYHIFSMYSAAPDFEPLTTCHRIEAFRFFGFCNIVMVPSCKWIQYLCLWIIPFWTFISPLFYPRAEKQLDSILWFLAQTWSKYLFYHIFPMYSAALNPCPLDTGLKLLGSWLLLYDQPFRNFYFYAILSPCWEAVGFNTVISLSNLIKIFILPNFSHVLSSFEPLMTCHWIDALRFFGFCNIVMVPSCKWIQYLCLRISPFQTFISMLFYPPCWEVVGFNTVMSWSNFLKVTFCCRFFPTAEQQLALNPWSLS